MCSFMCNFFWIMVSCQTLPWTEAVEAFASSEVAVAAAAAASSAAELFWVESSSFLVGITIGSCNRLETVTQMIPHTQWVLVIFLLFPYFSILPILSINKRNYTVSTANNRGARR